MLTISPTTRIFLVTGATDLRKAYDGLSEIVTGTLKEDPYSGHLFLFTNGRRNRLKLLVWDGTGLWVLSKRLEKGTFAWPKSEESTIDMTPEELWLLVGGIDLENAVRRPWYRREGVEKRKTLVRSR